MRPLRRDRGYLPPDTIINGTVFMAAPNDQFATRAITVLGATGRVRAYKRLNSAWGRV
jgi:hypothetical protein